MPGGVVVDPNLQKEDFHVLMPAEIFPNNDLLKIEIVNDVRSVKLLGNHIVF